ncbi:hypothetical protein P8S54_09705 [Thiomicrospira sp. R3]|uniref:hypothetical protein n=1 Tax=Thiomicrospira sp. R3 TaxID=3035472 RepID=UPI00259AF0A0|nr:hypothetical protein [Thiomicrospira sp. R3]WFE68471.1 hypothetical protein P8S54_09705 [Thiomicrospira sp. R3]
MTMKSDVQQIINDLPEEATWDDLIKELIRQRKITIGLKDHEIHSNDELSDADINTILARLHSSHSRPDDMRNTKTYKPGNATTLGMVAGIIAIVFAFVIPPISWLGAAIAVIAGGFGISRKEEKAWIPLLLAFVAVFSFFTVLN